MASADSAVSPEANIDVDYDLPSEDHELQVKIILLGDSAVGKSK